MCNQFLNTMKAKTELEIEISDLNRLTDILDRMRAEEPTIDVHLMKCAENETVELMNKAFLLGLERGQMIST